MIGTQASSSTMRQTTKKHARRALSARKMLAIPTPLLSEQPCLHLVSRARRTVPRTSDPDGLGPYGFGPGCSSRVVIVISSDERPRDGAFFVLAEWVRRGDSAHATASRARRRLRMRVSSMPSAMR